MIYMLLAAGIIAVFCGAAWLTDRLDGVIQRWLRGPIEDSDADDTPDESEVPE